MAESKGDSLSPGGSLFPRKSRLQPWEQLRTSLELARPPWLTVHRDEVRLPSGKVLDDFYRVVLPDFASIAAVTPAGELVLVEGYKHGLGRVSLCAPAGILEAGESPLAGAQRELLEETGYQAADWQCLGSFLLDGNRHCGTGHFFLARQAVQVAENNTADEAEELEVRLLKPRQFFEAIGEGAIALLPTATTIALALATGLLGDADYETPAGWRHASRPIPRQGG
ncbi:MAG: NUDIX hydrolase [Planctomycetes bacterium]|nr:NUDIX hydrolase [Planctomycetota bacterium]